MCPPRTIHITHGSTHSTETKRVWHDDKRETLVTRRSTVIVWSLVMCTHLRSSFILPSFVVQPYSRTLTTVNHLHACTVGQLTCHVTRVKQVSMEYNVMLNSWNNTLIQIKIALGVLHDVLKPKAPICRSVHWSSRILGWVTVRLESWLVGLEWRSIQVVLRACRERRTCALVCVDRGPSLPIKADICPS